MRKKFLSVSILLSTFLSVAFAQSNNYSKVRVIQTSMQSTDKLTEREKVSFGSMVEFNVPSITIDTNVKYQVFEGFGGAFTQSAAINFYKQSPENQQRILKAYFDQKEGLGYTLCRTHINSCDFSKGNFAYTETDKDTLLRNFSIDVDRKELIPFIKAGMKMAGPDFKLFASPWSPPAWMKTTGKMVQGGKLKPEYRKFWASYYARYIKEYAKEGIPIWGITVQNEPEAIQSWESCIYTAEEERDFVRDYLGPIMHKENLKDVKIIIWDHNRDRMYERAKTVYDDPKAAKYVWGTGFHWYGSESFENVQITHDAYPDKKLLFTEGCQEFGAHLNDWRVGERYAKNIINDLNRWTVGWVDWNLILDMDGGPNHVWNLCSAPVLTDSASGKYHHVNSYYYIGHFSKYIRPGARKILSGTTAENLLTTAFINKNGTISVVVMNNSEWGSNFALKFNGKAAKIWLPAHSIGTYLIEK